MLSLIKSTSKLFYWKDPLIIRPSPVNMADTQGAKDQSSSDKKSKQEWRPVTRRFTFSDIAANAFEPGVNKSVLLFINVVFLLLLLTIVLIIQFSTGYKLYMILLITLAFALFIGFNW